MTTREQIVDYADQLIRDKGFNAFSFKDISNEIGIKTASIHYHFPSKCDLGVATVQEHVARFKSLIALAEGKTARAKLDVFLSVYSKVKAENKVCIVGSLATDLNTVDEPIKTALQLFAGLVLSWVTGILEEGKRNKEFQFEIPARTKALMIITNMLAIVQLSRLTSDADFDTVKQTIIKDLKPKK